MSSWESVATISGLIAVIASAIGILSIVPALIAWRRAPTRARTTTREDKATKRMIWENDRASVLMLSALALSTSVRGVEDKERAARFEAVTQLLADMAANPAFAAESVEVTPQTASTLSALIHAQLAAAPGSQEFSDLVTALSEAVADPADILQVATEAGLDRKLVDLPGSAADRWMRVLTLASDSGDLRPLLKEVLRRSSDRELQAAVAAYLTS